MEKEERITEEELSKIEIEKIAGIEIRKYKTPANEMTKLEVDIWDIKDKVKRLYGDSIAESTTVDSWIINNDLEEKTMKIIF